MGLHWHLKIMQCSFCQKFLRKSFKRKIKNFNCWRNKWRYWFCIRGFEDKVNINLFILFPNKKVSIIQQKQMTTIFDKGCQSVAVNSDFDGCQSIVKTLFKDLKFKDEFSLSAINSVNWARLIPQVVYYFFSAFMVGAPQKKISFSVPTGNFGNIFSGWIAKQMVCQ